MTNDSTSRSTRSRVVALFAAALAIAGIGCPSSDESPRQGPLSPLSHEGPSPSVIGKPEVARVVFRDVAAEGGVDRQLVSGSPEKLSIAENIGTGVALFDANGDGREDLYFANAGRVQGSQIEPGPGAALYLRGDEGDSFRDATRGSGIESKDWCTGTAVGDVDNDGDLDLFVAGWNGSRLYSNRGDATFDDVTKESGILTGGFASSAVFFDFDRDGHLDLYVAVYVEVDLERPINDGQPCRQNGVPIACGPSFYTPGRDRLFRGLGEGRFKDVTAKAGLEGIPGGYGLGVLATDIDDDGWPDLYVANDTTANFLFRNRRDGTFEEIGLFEGAALSADGQGQAGMGLAATDLNADGRPDLFVTNYSKEPNAIYVSQPGGGFAESGRSTGLARQEAFLALGWGAAFFDADRDGDDDLFVANGHVYPRAREADPDLRYEQECVLYRARSATEAQFEPPTAITSPGRHRALATGDLDGDGDIDAVVTVQDGPPRVLRNDTETADGWISLELAQTTGQREAIGARVTIRIGGRTVVREVTRGAGFLASGSPRIHVGLGSAKGIDSMDVRWPDGTVETFGPVRGRRIHRVERGTGEVPR